MNSYLFVEKSLQFSRADCRLKPSLLVSIDCRYGTLKGSSTGEALGLLPNDHEFESSRGHWRHIWSLTSGPMRLVEVCARGMVAFSKIHDAMHELGSSWVDHQVT